MESLCAVVVFEIQACVRSPWASRVRISFVFSQKERLTYEQFLHLIDDRKQGALRVSVGLATNFSDVYHFLQFVQTMIDRPALASAWQR